MNRPAVSEEVWIPLARAAQILECSRESVRRFAIDEGRLAYRQLRPGGWIKVSLQEVIDMRANAAK